MKSIGSVLPSHEIGPVGRMFTVTRLVTEIRMLAPDRPSGPPEQAACPCPDP